MWQRKACRVRRSLNDASLSEPSFSKLPWPDVVTLEAPTPAKKEALPAFALDFGNGA